MGKIVIALGGNALLDPSGSQSLSRERSNMAVVSNSIAALCREVNSSVIITHGNGSQVGDELERNEHAKAFIPKLPLYILNAETQASIGTVIENSMRASLSRLHVGKGVCTVLANVVVSASDPAFKRPTKQVGPFYTKAELTKELRLNRFDYVKREEGYRRVVPSPKPERILELDAIRRSSVSNVVITCGGGGIPVIKSGGRLKGVDAVIDKDRTSQLLASSIGADKLVILTNADSVYEDYSKKKGRMREAKATELKKNLSSFEEGTIRPKIEACVRFIEGGGKEAYIGNVFRLREILQRKSGTRIR